MGKIVFAAPTIARFHLHQALGRQLLQRGNDVIVLAVDPVTHRFYRAQGMRSYLLPVQNAGHQLRGLPLTELARRDMALAGERMPNAGALARRERLLGRLVPGLLRWFGIEMPDLVLFHEQRSGAHRLIDYVAREYGCDVLHTGDGLLPGTMQWDQEGIDGDSAKMRCTQRSDAQVPPDETFVKTALAAVLGDAAPEPINREPVHAPGLTGRLGAALNALARGQLGPARHGLGAWRRARGRHRSTARSSEPADLLPESPFVAVLLQEPRDPRLWLDADHTTDPADLAVAAYAGTIPLDGDVPTVLIAPASAPDLAHTVASRLVQRPGRHMVCAAEDGRTAISTALAIVTVNHPHALIGLLAGTPVLHTGRALYGVSGVTIPTTLDRLRLDLAAGVSNATAAHRESFLTRALVYDHVWCNPDAPDRNGLRGLVQHVEARLANLSRGRSDAAEPLDYRAGPLWPSASTSES